MPIYEYRCGQCGGVSSFFTRAIGVSLDPVCHHCRSTNMQRRMSRFVQGRTVQSVHERHPSPSRASSLDYYSDPRNIGRHVEDSFQRFGMDLPASVRETIDAAREGNAPRGMEA